MRATIRDRVFRIDPAGFCAEGRYHFTVEPLTSMALRAQRCRLRMVVLLIATLIMGLCDLYFTITYMTSVGMVEINPLARMVVSMGNIPALVAFKMLLMGLSALMLYVARGHRAAEPIAWLCACVLFGLMVHWFNYNRDIADFTNEMAVLAMDGPTTGFVRVGS
ncbi:MAG: hypothetical protein KDA21_07410 [Phycisphaerales bacterium]|nr:hypothetical protein [Phycisphaerales bacterium]